MYKFIYLNENNNDIVIISNTITEKFVISLQFFLSFSVNLLRIYR